MKKLLMWTFVIVMPLATFAQNWTAEQQEVIDQIKGHHAAWAKAVKNKDFSIWKNKVRPVDDGRFWIGEDDMAMDTKSMESHFMGVIDNIKDFQQLDQRFLSVRVYGKVALASYFTIFQVQFTVGDPVKIKQKHMEVFQKDGKKWRWSDAMFTTENFESQPK